MLAVGEEINSKQVVLIEKGAKVTYQMLIRAIRSYQQYQKNKQANPKIPQGKITVKQLAKKDQGMSVLDLNDKDITKFDKIMKKYSVDYAVMTNKKADPPIHTIFFKGKDADSINKAFDEIAQSMKKVKGKPSVLKELKNMIEIVKNTSRDKVKNKENVR